MMETPPPVYCDCGARMDWAMLVSGRHVTRIEYTCPIEKSQSRNKN